MSEWMSAWPRALAPTHLPIHPSTHPPIHSLTTHHPNLPNLPNPPLGSFIIGYMMKKRGMSYVEALAKAREAR